MPVPPGERKVLLIIQDPIVNARGARLQQVRGWNSPRSLVNQFIADVARCSGGYAQFRIVAETVTDDFPEKIDGFRYTTHDYLTHWQSRRGFHQPDAINYHRLLADHQILERIDSGELDEVWLMGFPYAGYYESMMAGKGAFWCNAPPLNGTERCERRFVVMGFNFERGVGEMLENLGHRAESIMTKVFERHRPEDNLWERFTRYHLTHPHRAEVGNIHFAPNSERDYDWGNPRSVLSNCDSWCHFPHLPDSVRSVACAEWGYGDIRLHHLWWFNHLPRAAGYTLGVANNWWQYIINPNTVEGI